MISRGFRATVGSLALVTAVAVLVPVGTANATPTLSSARVNYHLSNDEKSVVATSRGGSFGLNPAGTELRVVSRAGKVTETVPLSGTMDGFTVPVAAKLAADRRSVELTPKPTASHRQALQAAGRFYTKRHPAAQRYTKEQRYNIMWAELNKGWARGASTPTAIGAVIGFLVGLVFIVGFLPGAAIGAAIGAWVGYQTFNPRAWPAVVAWWNTP